MGSSVKNSEHIGFSDFINLDVRLYEIPLSIMVDREFILYQFEYVEYDDGVA